jgi:MoaA/NifB/PqqE/SkfB family radical SAM enzyme
MTTTMIGPREKIFGHMDRLAELQSLGRTSAPINVEMDLSNRCSLGCSWCAFGHTHTRGPLKGRADKLTGGVAGGDLMDTSLALDIVRQLAEAGVRSLSWTGGGEPTLHPDFNAIVEYAGRRLPQGIYTNGCHIDEERAEILKGLFTFVYVSLDAVDAESYKAAKMVDRFDQACEGIRLLAEADGDATIGVGFLVTADNYRDVSKAGYLAHALGADYLQARPTVMFDVNAGATIAESTDWISHAINVIRQAQRTQPNIIADSDRFRLYQRWGGHGYETCWWSTLQTVITPNGKVWGCVNKREHVAAELGDLAVESLADIWARHTAMPVDDDCRVMCRGHLANLELDRVLEPALHPEFV